MASFSKVGKTRKINAFEVGRNQVFCLGHIDLEMNTLHSFLDTKETC